MRPINGSGVSGAATFRGVDTGVAVELRGTGDYSGRFAVRPSIKEGAEDNAPRPSYYGPYSPKCLGGVFSEVAFS
jgi:hypothetical protein